MDTRLLNPSDVDQITDIVHAQRKFIRKDLPAESKTHVVNKIVKMLTPNPAAQVYGAFKDQELKSFMYARRWVALPYYNLEGLFIRPGSAYFSLEESGMNSLFELMTKAQEKVGYNRWYYVRDIDGWPVKKMITQWNEVPAFQRYDMTVEAVIPAGKASPFYGFTTIIGAQVSTRDTLIGCGSLKQEFRETAALQPKV